MRRLTAAACLFALTAFRSIPAAAATPSPSVDEIVARHVQARGGLDALHALRSVIYRGTYREGDHVMPDAAMARMRPFYKLVGDPAKLNRDFAEGYDGSAWEFYGDPGIVVRTVGPAAAAARHGLAIDGPLVDYREKGSTIELRGAGKVGDRDGWWLRVRMRDGFDEDEFVDAGSWQLTASRKVAPIHAFGESVATEARFSDFRTVAGVVFAFADREVEIASGKVLNEMHWREIVVNLDLDPAVFSPPRIERTPLQALLDHLFVERGDREAVLWSYHDFRRAYPAVESDAGIQAIGYQMLKMGDRASAIALLEENAVAYPRSSGAFFGVGRAYADAGRVVEARAAFERALALDPANRRAQTALAALAGPRGG